MLSGNDVYNLKELARRIEGGPFSWHFEDGWLLFRVLPEMVRILDLIYSTRQRSKPLT